MSDLRVELLAVEGCPHFESTRKNLEAVLREGIIETPIQVVFVGSADDAEFLEFPGSPTVRINGEDVIPQPDLPVGLGCRIYRDEAGRILDGPPIDRMRDVVQAHRRAKLEAFQRQEARATAAFARSAADAEAAADGDAAAGGDAAAETSGEAVRDREAGGERDR